MAEKPQVFSSLVALCALAKAKLFGSIPNVLQQGMPSTEPEPSDRLLAALEQRLTPQGLTPQLLRELGLSETTTQQATVQTQGAGAVAKTAACPRTERDAW
ncbi:Uncharacterised protein [uncultured Comamonas sp.]|nr:Uncharacterised protein [uncultured Comamonas sp.]